MTMWPKKSTPSSQLYSKHVAGSGAHKRAIENHSQMFKRTVRNNVGNTAKEGTVLRIFHIGVQVVEFVDALPNLSNVEKKARALQLMKEMVKEAGLSEHFPDAYIDDVIETSLAIARGAYLINHTAKKCKLLCFSSSSSQEKKQEDGGGSLDVRVRSFERNLVAGHKRKARSGGGDDGDQSNAVRIMHLGAQVVEFVDSLPSLTNEQKKQQAVELINKVLSELHLSQDFPEEWVDDLIETVIAISKGYYVIHHAVKKFSLLCC